MPRPRYSVCSSGLACWVVSVGCVALLNPGDTRVVVMAAIVGSILVFQASDTIDLSFRT